MRPWLKWVLGGDDTSGCHQSWGTILMDAGGGVTPCLTCVLGGDDSMAGGSWGTKTFLKAVLQVDGTTVMGDYGERWRHHWWRVSPSATVDSGR